MLQILQDAATPLEKELSVNLKTKVVDIPYQRDNKISDLVVDLARRVSYFVDIYSKPGQEHEEPTLLARLGPFSPANTVSDLKYQEMIAVTEKNAGDIKVANNLILLSSYMKSLAQQITTYIKAKTDSPKK